MRILKDKKAESYIRGCISILIVCVVFVSLLNFVLVTILAKGQRKGALHILDQYTQLNAIDIYNNVKVHSDKTDSLDASVFIADLCLAQGLVVEDDSYVAYNSDGDCRYIVSDVTMSFTVEYTTKIHVNYTLTIPYNFWGTTTWIEVPLTITSKLDPKFAPDDSDGLVIYTVNHWKEQADGSYVLDRSWTLRGTAGEKVKPPVINYPGYDAPAPELVKVTADRTAVVNYYYTRLDTSAVAGEVILSANSGTVNAGETTTLTVTSNLSGGDLSVTTSDASIAKATINGDTITVTAVSGGTATITVTSSATEGYKEAKATYTITVDQSVVTYDIVLSITEQYGSGYLYFVIDGTTYTAVGTYNLTVEEGTIIECYGNGFICYSSRHGNGLAGCTYSINGASSTATSYSHTVSSDATISARAVHGECEDCMEKDDDEDYLNVYITITDG